MVQTRIKPPAKKGQMVERRYWTYQLTQVATKTLEKLDVPLVHEEVESDDDLDMTYRNDAWVLSKSDAKTFLEIASNPPKPSKAVLSVFED